MKVILLLCFLCITSTAKNPLSREYRKFRTFPRLDRAYKMIDQNRYSIAEELLLDVISIDPNLVEAYNALVNLYVKTNRLPDAEQYVVKLSPKESGLHNYVEALKPKMQGVIDTSGALVIPYSLVSANAKLDLAHILIEQGYFERAEEKLINLHYYYSDELPSREALFTLYMTTGDTSKASLFFDKLSSDNPYRMRYASFEPTPKSLQSNIERPSNSSITWKRLTPEQKRYAQLNYTYYLIKNNSSDVLKNLSELFSEYPSDTEIGQLYVQHLISHGDYETAEVIARSFKHDSAPRYTFLAHKMNSLLNEKRFKEASEIADSLNLSNDSLSNLHSYIKRAEGYEYVVNNEYVKAEEAFRSSLKYIPDSPETLEALAFLLLKQEKLNELSPFINKISPDSDLTLHYYLSRSIEQREHQNYKQAELLLNQIDSSHHSDVRYLSERAYVAKGNGNDKLAITLFKQSRELSNQLHFTREIAFAQQSIEEYDSAAIEFKRAVNELEEYHNQFNMTSTEATLDSFVIQRTNYYLKKQWNFSVSFQPRLNSFESGNNQFSPFDYATYSGYSSFEASFSPTLLRKQVSFFGNSLVILQDQSPFPTWDSYQLGFGVRAQPFQNIPVTTTLQYNFGLGNNVRNIFMGRIASSFSKSMDWNPVEPVRLFTNNYGEIAYFIGEKIFYTTGHSELGPTFRIRKGQFAANVVPYSKVGINLNTDNLNRDLLHRFDVGVGASLFLHNWYDPYKSYRLRNRLSVEFKHALLSSGSDKSALHFKWELSI